MRYVWVDAGADVDYFAADRHLIDGFYFPLFHPHTTTARLKSVAASGNAVGLYVASNWPELAGLDGAGMASKINAELKALAWNPTNGPKLQVDLEEHRSDIIIACLERLRELQPKRDISWTFEPLQGGWMHSEFVKRVVDARVRVVPQTYGGSMQPFAADVVLRDLLRRGFPEPLVTCFYDAAALPHGWNGWAFTQQRLP